MCLGIPGRVVGLDPDNPDLASVEVEGVARRINIGILDQRPDVGSWVMVHMGFALEPMTEQEARDAREFMAADQRLVDEILTPDPSGAARADPFAPAWAKGDDPST